MKLADLRYLPKVMGPRDRLFAIGAIGGIPVCLVISYFNPLASGISQAMTLLIGGMISIAVILSSIVNYCVQVVKEKKGEASFLPPLVLIILAIVFAVGAYFTTQLFYFASYYLLLGTGLFLNEIRVIMSEQIVGVTLGERITYESRQKRMPYLGDKSSVGQKIFAGKVDIYKGDTILASCEFIQEGRALAKKIVNNAEYVIYISSDRPYTLIEEELRERYAKLYCIDCFTNVYGLGEFKQAEKESTSYTLNPPTIRELHVRLREIRRRIVSEMLFQKDWAQLNKVEAAELERELASLEAKVEREKNVWIIYDTISSLAAVFDLEPLLTFLVHDTTVDISIGRNTLLLLKEGELDSRTVSRLESISEHILSAKMKDNKICFNVVRSIGMGSFKDLRVSDQGTSRKGRSRK